MLIFVLLGDLETPGKVVRHHVTLLVLDSGGNDSGARRFGDLPRRWGVERTFSWLSQDRRVSKDCGRLAGTREVPVYGAMSCLVGRRLARS